MIPEKYIKQLEEAQRVRDEINTNIKFDSEDIIQVEELIKAVCSKSEFQKFFDPLFNLPYFANALQMTVIWYTDELDFSNIKHSLYRSEVSKTVLFREYILLSLLSLEKTAYIEQIVNLSSLKDYAMSGCNLANFNRDHYYLHSSHSMKNLSSEEYLKIDKHKFAPILYPMYEAEIIASIISIIASTLDIYYNVREKIRKKHQKQKEELIVKNYINDILLKDQKELLNILLQEMYIREKKLFDYIRSKDGTIESKELSDIYIIHYFPELEKIRNNSKYFQSKYPEKFQEITEFISSLVPAQCIAITKSGQRCSRLINSKDKYCKQHRNM